MSEVRYNDAIYLIIMFINNFLITVCILPQIHFLKLVFESLLTWDIVHHQSKYVNTTM